MKKSITIICVLFALLAGNLPVSAQYVTQEAAREKANAFLKRSNSQSAARKAPRKAPMLTLANNRDEFYVFNDEANGGYVVISGEERMPDVLAFSFEESIDPTSIPCNMQAWMDDCAVQVRWLREHPEVATERRKSPQRADIAPLLTCEFNQGSPYNLKCPIVDGEHCATGCTATAMAQIMYYHQWPKKTTFTIPAYTTTTLKIEMPAIPPTTIDWDNIPNSVNSRSSAEEKDAVSTLMALCGAAVKMDYNLEASGAFQTPKAYDLLDYDITSMQKVYRDDFSDADWEKLLYNELQQKRPIDYSGYSAGGGGHTFVIDGYRYLDETAYWHVNWGWGGGYVNAGPYYKQQYYTLDNMSYNNDQSAIIGIQPALNGRAYAVDEAGGKTTLYYDTEAGSKGDKARPIWIYYREKGAVWSSIGSDVTEVEFHPSFANCKPKTFSFNECENLKQIKGIEYLNTEEMTDMSGMFYNCSSLTSLDLSNFNTANVTYMSRMFYNCSSLTSLDLSNFNTANVTNMYGMFAYCSNLTSLDVSGFKTDNVTNMGNMFYYCSNLTSLDVSGFKTYKVTDMYSMFFDCSNLTSLDVSGFKTDNVTSMCEMFYGCSNLTSLDVSGFKTDNVTNMANMFRNCQNLTSLDVSGFKTDNVTNMQIMFSGCENLTSLDVSGFKTDNVTNMSWMFSRCSNLTSLDVSGFKTDKVTDMNGMFAYCSNLTSLDVSGFKTDKVTNMYYMFFDCSKLTSLDVSGFKTDNVTNMNGMFDGCSNLTSLDVSGFKTDKVTDMSWMFSGCENLTSLDVSGFKTDKVTDMLVMFAGCSNLTILDVSGFKTDNVTNMRNMFSGCENLTSLDVSGFKTDKVTDMIWMFNGCKNLTSLDVSGFKTDNVTNMANMFRNCQNLTSLDVSGFKTDKVKNMYCMFSDCSNLTSLDVSGFKTDKVTDMGNMFRNCQNLTSLDVSGFKTDKVTDMSWMFASCSNLTTIYASKSWDMSSVTSSDYMFYNCPNLVGGAGTTFDRSHTNGEYARIDEGASNPGYLTYKVSTEIASPELLGAKQSGVYNLGGAKVRSAQEGANGLPSGLYIVNKKKILVK